MKMVPVHQAAGSVLCHDLTQIVLGEFQSPSFKKGHILREEDIPRLLDMGKEHVYVWEMHSGLLIKTIPPSVQPVRRRGAA